MLWNDQLTGIILGGLIVLISNFALQKYNWQISKKDKEEVKRHRSLLAYRILLFELESNLKIAESLIEAMKKTTEKWPGCKISSGIEIYKECIAWGPNDHFFIFKVQALEEFSDVLLLDDMISEEITAVYLSLYSQNSTQLTPLTAAKNLFEMIDKLINKLHGHMKNMET